MALSVSLVESGWQGRLYYQVFRDAPAVSCKHLIALHILLQTLLNVSFAVALMTLWENVTSLLS